MIGQKRGLFLFWCFVAAVLVVGEGHAADGRTPVWEPTTITTSGHYVLTRDISGPGTVVSIVAPRVTLDLNGFGLDNSGTSSPVLVLTSGARDLVVRNGRIRGGSSCIDSTGASALRIVIEDLDCTDPQSTAINLPSVETFQVRRARIAHGFGFGLIVTGARGGIVEDCTIQDLEGDGIRVNDAKSVILRHNTISKLSRTIGYEWAGIRLSSPSGGDNLVEGNVISDVGAGDGFGIFVVARTGSIVRSNTVSGTVDGAIHVNGDASRVTDNVIHSRGVNPAVALMANGRGIVVANNVLSTSHSYGISVGGDFNVIEGNTVDNSGNCGVSFNGGTTSVYRGNVFKGSSPGVCQASGATDGGGNLF